MTWKLKRLLQPYAWKKSINFVTVFLLLLIVLGEYIINVAPIKTSLVTIFRIVAYPVLLFSIIDKVCAATETFYLNESNMSVDIYDEKDKHKRHVYQLICKSELNGKSQKEVLYAYKYLQSVKSILYHSAIDKIWYKLKFIGKKQRIGTYINDILFIDELNNNLSFIELKYVKSISYDRCFFFSNLYFPKEIEIFSIDNIPLKFPKEVIAIKKGDKYSFYGMYYDNDMLYYREIIVSSVIIRDEQKRIVLVRKNEEYVVLADKEVFSRQLNSIIIEAKNMSNKGLEVLVWHFDAKEQKLQKLYEGIAYAIDFEKGIITGEDGKTYGQ